MNGFMITHVIFSPLTHHPRHFLPFHPEILKTCLNSLHYFRQNVLARAILYIEKFIIHINQAAIKARTGLGSFALAERTENYWQKPLLRSLLI